MPLACAICHLCVGVPWRHYYGCTFCFDGMHCTILGDFRDMLCITIALHSNTILSDKNITVNVSCFNTLLAMNFVAYLPAKNKQKYLFSLHKQFACCICVISFSVHISYLKFHLRYSHHFSCVVCRPFTFFYKMFFLQTSGSKGTKLNLRQANFTGQFKLYLRTRQGKLINIFFLRLQAWLN